MEKAVKQFKNKRTGEVVSNENIGGVSYYTIKDNSVIPSRFIEGSSDWEEVVETVYPEGIVAVMLKGSKYSYAGSPGNYQTWVSEILVMGAEIHTVLSGVGEEISIGDQVTWGNGRVIVNVSGLRIQGGVLLFDCEDFGGASVHGEHPIRKYTPKPVLFTTDDGVDVFHKDKYWWICEPFILTYKIAFEGESYSKDVKRFSTEAAAKEYIKQNQPVFSRKQINEAILCGVGDGSPAQRQILKALDL